MSQTPMNQNYTPMSPAQSSGMAIASLVLGIISLFICLSWVAAACGVLAIIFGLIAMNKVKAGTGGGGGMAKAGFIMGCIGLALDVLIIILAMMFGVSILQRARQMQQQQLQSQQPIAPAPAPAPSSPGSSSQSFHLGLAEQFEFRGVTISF